MTTPSRPPCPGRFRYLYAGLFCCDYCQKWVAWLLVPDGAKCDGLDPGRPPGA